MDPEETQKMRKKLLLTVAASLAAGAAIGGAAVASSGWHVFAAATDDSDYASYASADATVLHPHGLAVRASTDADISWTVSCDGKQHVRAGQVVALAVPSAKTCRVYGSASNDGGLIRVELLKR